MGRVTRQASSGLALDHDRVRPVLPSVLLSVFRSWSVYSLLIQPNHPKIAQYAASGVLELRVIASSNVEPGPETLPPYDRLPGVTFHQLRIFRGIVNEGGFARAAEALSASEATVSNQIKALEQVLQARLFERAPGRRKVQLTAAGQVLLQTCTEMFDVLRLGFDRIAALTSDEFASVSIGAASFFGVHALPPLCVTFRQRHPQVTIRAIMESRRSTLEQIRHRHLDLAVLIGGVDDPDLVCHSLMRFDMVLVAAADHPLAGRRSLSLRDLQEESWILGEETASSRKWLEQLAAEARIRLNVALEANNVEIRLRAVASGVGIAPLSRAIVAERVNSGEFTLLDAEQFPFYEEWCLIHSRDPLTPAAQAFKDHILRHCNEIQEGFAIIGAPAAS